MQKVQDSMDDVLSHTDLSSDEKAKRWLSAGRPRIHEFQTTVHWQLNASTVRHGDAIEREEINSTFPEQIRKQDFSTSKVSSATDPF